MRTAKNSDTSSCLSVVVQAFGRLVAAVAGSGDSPELDATAMWVGLHGYAVLNARVPAFPWPGGERMLDRLLTRFA
ncbi:UNVERIFIED_ORG: hypothetical protein FHR35_005501 [Microbispora rosea subsp. rosea]